MRNLIFFKIITRNCGFESDFKKSCWNGYTVLNCGKRIVLFCIKLPQAFSLLFGQVRRFLLNQGWKLQYFPFFSHFFCGVIGNMTNSFYHWLVESEMWFVFPSDGCYWPIIQEKPGLLKLSDFGEPSSLCLLFWNQPRWQSKGCSHNFQHNSPETRINRQ